MSLLRSAFADRGHVCKFARWPQVRPALEQTDVDAVEFQRGDEVEHLVVRQEREREIRAGQFAIPGPSRCFWSLLLSWRQESINRV